MQTEWAPMSVRAAIQSRVDKGNALAKFSKKLGKDSVHPRKQTWNPNFLVRRCFSFSKGVFHVKRLFSGVQFGLSWLRKKKHFLMRSSI